MAREAALQEDRFARASFIEGMLDYSPGTLLSNNLRQIDEAAEALESGSPNRIVEHLLYERGMDEADAKALLGNRDRKLFEALMAGVRSGMPREGVRGIEPLDVLQSLVAGISPITMKRYPQYKGGNVFWFLGSRAPMGTSMAGIARVLKEHGRKKATDVVRGTTRIDLGPSLSDRGPAESGRGQSEDEANVLGDMLSGESAVTRADYVQMAEAIFQNPAIMRILDREVRSYLGGPGQIAVWEGVKNNPHYITVKADRRGEQVIGVDQQGLAEVVAKATGKAISPQAVGKTWRTKVWPAMKLAFQDSDLARALLKNRQIMEIVEEESRRRAPVTEKIRDIRELGDPGPQYGVIHEGPYNLPPDDADVRWDAPKRSPFYEREMEKVRKKYKALRPGVWASSSASRVAARHAEARGLPVSITENQEVRRVIALDGTVRLEKVGDPETKVAWRLPAREARLYSQLRKWAIDNWERWRTPRGDLDTDEMAEAIAEKGGQRLEIAYDVNRMVPSLAI
jgi:hypothetical protein